MMPGLCVMMGAAGSRRPDGPRPRQSACPGPGPFVTRPGTLTRGTYRIMLSSATYPIDTPDGDAPGERRHHRGHACPSRLLRRLLHIGSTLPWSPSPLCGRSSLHRPGRRMRVRSLPGGSPRDLLFLRGKPAPLASAYSDWTP